MVQPHRRRESNLPRPRNSWPAPEKISIDIIRPPTEKLLRVAQELSPTRRN
jgi:hypothetical protein